MTEKYNSVKWMRDQRTKIDKEDKDLSWAEKRKKTHSTLKNDPILSKLAKRAEIPKRIKVDAVGEEQSKYNI